MENKLTAVEWLIDNLHYLHSTKWDDILIKAKEMEKEQIIDAFKEGFGIGLFELGEKNSGEQYYTQTFNK